MTVSSSSVQIYQKKILHYFSYNMTTTTTTKEYTNVAAEPTDDVSAAKDQKEAERAGDQFAEKNPSVTTNPSTAKLQPEFAGPKTAHVTETTIQQ